MKIQIEKNFENRLSKVEVQNAKYFDHLINNTQFSQTGRHPVTIKADNKINQQSHYANQFKEQKKSQNICIINQNNNKFKENLIMNINTTNRQDYKNPKINNFFGRYGQNQRNSECFLPIEQLTSNQFNYLNWKPQTEKLIEPPKISPEFNINLRPKQNNENHNMVRSVNDEDKSQIQLVNLIRYAVFKSPLNPNFKVKVKTEKQEQLQDYNQMKIENKSYKIKEQRIEKADFKNQFKSTTKSDFPFKRQYPVKDKKSLQW